MVVADFPCSAPSDCPLLQEAEEEDQGSRQPNACPPGPRRL